MATDKQKLGAYGEKLVTALCACPKCKAKKTLKRLPPNFKCADVICDFCGFLAQVKCSTQRVVSRIPASVPGAAWEPQKERMDKGIYMPLFIVLKNDKKEKAIYYLSADAQQPEMFVPRNKLKKTARRAGWQGFNYDLRRAGSLFIRIV